jgi:hypothetical protein
MHLHAKAVAEDKKAETKELEAYSNEKQDVADAQKAAQERVKAEDAAKSLKRLGCQGNDA